MDLLQVALLLLHNHVFENAEVLVHLVQILDFDLVRVIANILLGSLCTLFHFCWGQISIHEFHMHFLVMLTESIRISCTALLWNVQAV